MNNSNGYILRYAAIMVIIAAALLSSAAMLLKPFQEKNMAIEKMGGILDAAGITGISTDEMITSFNKYVKEEIVINQDGKVVDVFEGKGKEKGKAFNINLKEQYFNKSQGKPYELPLYVLEKDGKTIYIIPLLGTGLWGPIWGNLALKEDLNTVIGVYFDHKGETPGLGAEITTKQFTSQFVGKKIFDDNGKFTSIMVVKGGVKKLPKNEQIHGVDAISGGTITSNGVNDMIKNVLESYLPYIDELRKKH
jgi:Na+-transporting NADH:ubiquinone oxidoreductase subunit C